MDPNSSGNNLPDQVVIDTPALFLPIDDAALLATLNEAESRAKSAYDTKKYQERSEKNVDFWRGNQVDESKLDARYQMAHVDNVSFQDMEKQIKLASSKMPDIFVAPPDKDDFNMEAARDLQQWLRERMDTNTIKRLVKNGLRSLNLNLIGIIKPRWDYSKADFTFELLNPKDVRFAEGARIVEDGFTIDEVDIVFQYVEESTQVVLAKFKKKQNDLISEIGIQTKDRTKMPSRLRYTECHFRWFDDQGRLNEGVCWRYGNLIMESMKEPYYDYDNPAINYFDRPRKPYILFSYLNLGDGVYEATTSFEQSVPLNRIINKRRRQITEISDRAVPKLAFSGASFTKEQAQNISPSPQEGILLNDLGPQGDIRKSMFVIPATPPNPILYNDLNSMYQRIDSMFETGGTNNATVANTASGVSKQIGRESDMVTSDDIVDVVVERVVTEMSAWAMQFARLFYDDDRKPMRAIGEESDINFVELNRQKIETDIQVIVKASTTDKSTRRNDALQMLTGKVTDPFTLFEDLDVPNPKERTRRLMSFITSQAAGDWSTYLEMIGVDLSTNKADQAQASRDIETILMGQQPSTKTNPSESYVSTFLAFVNSPAFATLTPQMQQILQQHIQAMKANVDAEAAARGPAPGQQPQPGQPGQPQPGAPGQSPQPGVPGQPAAAPYAPSVDTSTVFTGALGAESTAASRQGSMANRSFFPVSSAPLRQA